VKKRWLTLFLLLVGAMVLMVAIAGAEEQTEEAHVAYGDLYWCGGIPEMSDISVVPKSVDGLEEYLVNQILLFKPEITVSQFNLQPDTFVSWYWLILNDHPELFFLHDSFTYYTSSTNIVTKICPEYSSNGSDMKARTAWFNAEVDEIASYANQSTSQLGKLMLVNDYFCANYTYDYSYSNYSPELFFRDKTGVCQAYTMAYKAVLDRLGITSTSVYSKEMNHVWNLVYLDGSWYHIDVTWDDEDGKGARPFTAKHNNFLLSDSGIMDAGHDSWQTLNNQKASNTKYDSFFWKDIYVPIPVVGSTLYYVDQSFSGINRNIRSWQVGSSSTSIVHTFSVKSADRDIYYCCNGYYPLFVKDSQLHYVVQHQIFSVGLNGGTPSLKYTLDIDNYNIWSIFQNGNMIHMFVTPNNSFAQWQTISMYWDLPTDIQLQKWSYETSVGKSVQLYANVTPSTANVPLTWESWEPHIATVDANGMVTGVSTGYTFIEVSYGDLMATCCVVVHSDAPLHLPDDLDAIEEEAFRGTAVQDVIIPEGVTSIGPYAFADCKELLLVKIPDSVTEIDPTAFNGWIEIIILCNSWSAAENFVYENDLPVIFLDQ